MALTKVDQSMLTDSVLYYRLASDAAGGNVTTAQNILGVGVTLDPGVLYEFEGSFLLLKTAGATSHNISFGFGGTATLTSIGWQAVGNCNTTANMGWNNIGTVYGVSVTAQQIIGSTANVTNYAVILVRGTVLVNAGGTFIPQYTLSAAPGGAYSTKVGSFFALTPKLAATNGTWA